MRASWILGCWAFTHIYHAVDGKQRSWIGPNQFVQGIAPFQRDSFGFTSVEGKLFVYGGIGDTIGELCPAAPCYPAS